MKKIKFESSAEICKIVADGGISIPDVGEGRFIPILVIETADYSFIPEFIRMHQSIDSGDTKLKWGLDSKNYSRQKQVYLNITVLKPVELDFFIEFDIESQCSLVDAILQARSLILQTGKFGDKASDLKKPKLLFEVPDLDFDREWNNIFIETLIRIFRKKGNSKKVSKRLAINRIDSIRELWKIRRS
jgi:hypothetical protein